MPTPLFATPHHAPIDLSEDVLTVIVLHLRGSTPATADAEARSLYAGVMGGIGSVCRSWRRLVKGVLMGDETAWLRVSRAAGAAECMACFPRARSLRIVGGARGGDIGAVLGSRSVVRLALCKNDVVRNCEGLGQLVGLRALHITECRKLRDVSALSSLVGLRTLQLRSCAPNTATLAASLAAMPELTSLDLGINDLGAAGAAWLAASLAVTTKLTSLELCVNAIGAAGAASLAPSLAART
jgi:hypothetical protein